ncbi:MAG TPA: hypothetical protein VJ242_01285 [Patescibacteria group bacterium]|nr:hypothetical protein [Patescibacteria group bacterium]
MQLQLKKLLGKQVKQEKLAAEVEARIVDRLIEVLSPETIVKLSQMAENDDENLETYLKENCQEFDKIVDEEINRANQDKR